MKQVVLLLLLGTCSFCPAKQRAKNIILFLGDAGGLPVINAAAAYNGAPQSLYIQKMPYIGLSDTSTASTWVSDSAAGMTALVTGQKTHNGVISQSEQAIRGKRDGHRLKTILEYAEEHGLSTGVITNDKVTGATPAACYAHSNDRNKSGEILAQLLKPAYGDGVDLLIGPGITVLEEAASAAGFPVEPKLVAGGYSILRSLEEFQPTTQRALVFLNSNEFDIDLAVERTIGILSRNRKGYFLMVECDLHTTKLRQGLDRVLLLDRIIEKTARTVKNDTLILFTADHSFDTRVKGGKRGEPLIPDSPIVEPNSSQTETKKLQPPIHVYNGHTGEEVLVAAQGPGAEQVKGFLPNTQIFHILMKAYGWRPDSE